MTFDFFNPVKLITGEGCVLRHSGELSKLGKSCLIVTDASSAKKSGALGDAIKALENEGIRYTVFDRAQPNPTLTSCIEAGKTAKAEKLEFVLGIGGGSPLDLAKAAAVYAANDMADGLNIYKLDWKNRALPVAVIGTTAGTGSEITCVSVLTRPDGRKKSVGREDLYARVMFGDARYTATLPMKFTLSTALDALSHAIESYFNRTVNSMTDLFAVEAAVILCEQLKLLQSAKDIGDISAWQREQLYFASVLAGYSLSQAGAVYCHTLGYYLTEEYDVPHGFACAATLPDLVMRGEKYAPERADALFKRANTPAKELCGLIESLTEIPKVKIPKDVIIKLSEESANTKNFAKTIPHGLTKEDSVNLLTRLFG